MKIIGLTGGIASGKSTVSQMIRRMGVPVVCADELARTVVQKGKPALKKISKIFGKEVLHPDGSLNRASLASIIFANNAKRKILNKIIHPFVIAEMKAQIKKFKKENVQQAVLDIPLLFEEKLDKMCGKVVLVYAPEKIMAKRLQEREGLGKKEIKNRIASQIKIKEKKKRADIVIDNSKSLQSTQSQVNKIFRAS